MSRTDSMSLYGLRWDGLPNYQPIYVQRFSNTSKSFGQINRRKFPFSGNSFQYYRVCIVVINLNSMQSY